MLPLETIFQRTHNAGGNKMNRKIIPLLTLITTSCEIQTPQEVIEPPACCSEVTCPEQASECFEQCLYNLKGEYSCGCACKPPEAEYPDLKIIDYGCRYEEIGPKKPWSGYGNL